MNNVINIDKLINSIKEKYSDTDICSLFDEEILEWDYGYTEEEISEDWDSRYDFYMDMHNGEAQSQVLSDLLVEFGLTTNELYEMDNGVSFEMLTTWLTNYTDIDFD